LFAEEDVFVEGFFVGSFFVGGLADDVLTEPRLAGAALGDTSLTDACSLADARWRGPRAATPDLSFLAARFFDGRLLRWERDFTAMIPPTGPNASMAGRPNRVTRTANLSPE
jgi:hypothetical protein